MNEGFVNDNNEDTGEGLVPCPYCDSTQTLGQIRTETNRLRCELRNRRPQIMPDPVIVFGPPDPDEIEPASPQLDICAKCGGVYVSEISQLVEAEWEALTRIRGKLEVKTLPPEPVPALPPESVPALPPKSEPAKA